MDASNYGYSRASNPTSHGVLYFLAWYYPVSLTLIFTATNNFTLVSYVRIFKE